MWYNIEVDKWYGISFVLNFQDQAAFAQEIYDLAVTVSSFESLPPLLTVLQAIIRPPYYRELFAAQHKSEEVPSSRTISRSSHFFTRNIPQGCQKTSFGSEISRWQLVVQRDQTYNPPDECIPPFFFKPAVRYPHRSINFTRIHNAKLPQRQLRELRVMKEMEISYQVYV